MRILFAGIIARYPFGGVTWCSLMYLLGLRALGHEVFYIEDTGECVYDPVQNTRATDPAYGTTYIHNALEPFGLGDRWSFVNYDGSYHGRSADDVRRYAAGADLFINLSGGSWFWRDEYARIPRKVFIDSDPAFTQLAIAKAEPWYVAVLRAVRPPVHLRREHRHAGVADSDRRVHLAQDLAADHAGRLAHGRRRDRSPRDRFTTRHDLADRELHRRRRQQGSGVREVHRSAVANAAALRARDQRTAAAAARTRLGDGGRDGGLAHADRTTASSSSGSKAEFGVAKHTYVANRSGWFSDRTECYLASGRPALVQDTGWTAHLPSGEGLLAFSTPDEAIAGIDRINADYDRHARRAVEIAREHFDAVASCCRSCSGARRAH